MKQETLNSELLLEKVLRIKLVKQYEEKIEEMKLEISRLKELAAERYNIKDLGIEFLVGKTVYTARINEEKDLVVLETNVGPIYLTWNGNCCAHCYLAHVTGAENLVGATILEAVNAEWKDVLRNEDEYEVIESMGTNIKTSKGYVTFESRVSHNGYYGGDISVSDLVPQDQYSSPRYKNDYPEIYELKDF